MLMTRLDAYKMDLEWSQKNPAKGMKLHEMMYSIHMLAGILFGIYLTIVVLAIYFKWPVIPWGIVMGIIAIVIIFLMVGRFIIYSKKFRFPWKRWEAAYEREER